MTTRYVGIGGNDGNDGLSWAQRKLTLNGVEDTPVVGGDTVYVGPGAYREQLTVDVSGSGGNIITYIADVTGENTDGIGGIVRITGSDNDTSGTRAICITASGKDFRTFRGFFIDSNSGGNGTIRLTSPVTWIIEDCYFELGEATRAIWVDGADQAGLTVRRCFIFGVSEVGVYMAHGSTLNDVGHLIENCIFVSGQHDNVRSVRVGGITVKNCSFIGTRQNAGVRVDTALAGGQTVDVNNCIFYSCEVGVGATTTGELVEDYNTFVGVDTDRQNCNVGANSVTSLPLFLPRIQMDGFVFPWNFGELSEWSSLGRKAGTSEAADDFFGIVRPTTSAKKSWGAVQLREAERETGTVEAGSVSLKLADASDHQIFVPVTNAEITFTAKVARETDYEGTNPRMIIRQPGQSDDVTTDAGAASAFNTITTTLTPAADPPYVVLLFRSLNTASSGNYGVYFDTLSAS